MHMKCMSFVLELFLLSLPLPSPPSLSLVLAYLVLMERFLSQQDKAEPPVEGRLPDATQGKHVC